jgi:hypothetical protein
MGCGDAMLHHCPYIEETINKLNCSRKLIGLGCEIDNGKNTG